MQADKYLRLCAGAGLLVGALALAGCGQEAETSADEDAYAGFDIEETTPVEMPEADEEDLVDGSNAEAMPDQVTDAADPITDDDPSIQNTDVADVGEDMFRRGLHEEAMGLWEANAEAGDSYAAYRLGVEYYDGNYVERDMALSLRYQTLASELGNAPAMFELASFLEAGIGVSQDIEEAADWYYASALRGYAPAQHNVATLFEDGVGVRQDLVQAYLFYGLAAEQGFHVAFAQVHGENTTEMENQMDRIAEVMTEEQIADAQTLLESFVPIQ